MMLALSVAITVPLLLLVLLVDNAQTRFLLLFFVWGSTAGFLASVINSELLVTTGITIQALQIQFAPLVEELLKAAPLGVLWLVASKYLQRREIVFAAVFAGFGFSLVENFSYLIQQQQLSSLALTQYVITRSVSTTVMHGTTTGCIGAMLYVLSGETLDAFGYKPLFVLYSYCVAVLLHALFNIVVLFAVLGQSVAILSGLVSYIVLWLLFRTRH